MFVDPFRLFPSFRKTSERSRTKNDSYNYSRERLIIHNYDSHNNQRWELLILMRDKQSVIRVQQPRTVSEIPNIIIRLKICYDDILQMIKFRVVTDRANASVDV